VLYEDSNDINLRKKLIEAGAKDYIKTMYATGYKLTNQ